MEQFIYVFNSDARDILLGSGFQLVKSDDKNGIYIFANQPTMTFALSQVSYIASNTLTF